MRRLQFVLIFALGIPGMSLRAEPARPNILWLTSEDNGPHLGCYGDPNASTPNLDRLAEEGFRYRVAWSNVPVCAPARAAIISGLYPSSAGTEPMRTRVRLPEHIRLLPELLRKGGYYCTNNSKTDYNIELDRDIWDESSGRAHWRNRLEDQPFFAVFNFMTTHESMIRRDFGPTQTDPEKVQLPPYHPDTPESRLDWARYYDRIAAMDSEVGERLRELRESGLDDETIVIYFGDHGASMPRSKRSPYNSGLHVPLIIRVPPRFRHLLPNADLAPGSELDRLVSFVDLAPTVLSMTNEAIPVHMQGLPFLGSAWVDPPTYLFGSRSRMDERFDLVRVVRDHRFIYIRNFMPHRPHGQHVAYQFQTVTTRQWYDGFRAGTLAPHAQSFWEPRPEEELYDLQNDIFELDNLASDPAHAETLHRHRKALESWMLETRDLGFIPEPDLASLHGGESPMIRGGDSTHYPFERVLKIAQMASGREFDPDLANYLEDPDATVRYWAATGLLIHRTDLPAGIDRNVTSLLEDPSPSVRIVVSELLAHIGGETERIRALDTLLQLSDLRENHFLTVNFALNAIDTLETVALPIRGPLEELPEIDRSLPFWARSYTRALLHKTLEDLSGSPSGTRQ